MMSFIETNAIVHLEQDNRSFGGLIDSLLVEDEVFDWAGHFHVVAGDFHDGVEAAA
jgi:hypothetical protein